MRIDTKLQTICDNRSWINSSYSLTIIASWYSIFTYRKGTDRRSSEVLQTNTCQQLMQYHYTLIMTKQLGDCCKLEN